MRLDMYLKLSRLIQQRTLAKEYTKAGQVFVNDVVAKSSYDVKINDVITIKRRTSITRVKVVEVPQTKQVAKKNANELYELLAQEPIDILTD